MEDEEEPMVKKFKPNKNSMELDYDTLRNKKNHLVGITRNMRNGKLCIYSWNSWFRFFCNVRSSKNFLWAFSQ